MKYHFYMVAIWAVNFSFAWGDFTKGFIRYTSNCHRWYHYRVCCLVLAIMVSSIIIFCIIVIYYYLFVIFYCYSSIITIINHHRHHHHHHHHHNHHHHHHHHYHDMLQSCDCYLFTIHKSYFDTNCKNYERQHIYHPKCSIMFDFDVNNFGTG